MSERERERERESAVEVRYKKYNKENGLVGKECIVHYTNAQNNEINM